MTTYYIELFQFSNDADISKISTNTLKEVINDFTNELNKRCTEQKLNIHVVMQAEGSDGAEGAAVGNSAAGQSGSVGFNTENYHCFKCKKMMAICNCDD